MTKAAIKALGPDPMARLRRLRGADAPPADDVAEAMAKVFATTDGKVVLNWLIDQSYGRTVPDDAPESALRANETRKRLIDAIFILIEKGDPRD